MELQKKESYTEPVLIAHELLRDVTGQSSTRSSVRRRADANCRQLASMPFRQGPEGVSLRRDWLVY